MALRFSIQAAYETGCSYVTPDFSAFNDKAKDLWQLGGDEAVITLRDVTESIDADTDIDALKRDYLGKPNFFKEVNKYAASIYRPSNDEGFVQKLLEFAKPHLSRLGLTDETFLDEIGIKSLIQSLQKVFKNRALARHFRRHAYRQPQYIGCIHKAMPLS